MALRPATVTRSTCIEYSNVLGPDVSPVRGRATSKRSVIGTLSQLATKTRRYQDPKIAGDQKLDCSGRCLYPDCRPAGL